MPTTNEPIKRNTAYKIKVNDIKIGKPILKEERFAFLELGDKKIVRVNIIGNIVEKYDSPPEKQYSFLTLDDGSGQIKIKAFGDDIEKVNSLTQGQSVLIIGVLRYFNNEVYISPEITRILKPEYLLVRKLELEKLSPLKSNPNPGQYTQYQGQPEIKEKIIAVKDKILDLVKNSEENGGIEVDAIIMQTKEASPEIINQEIKKMLEEGIAFEPRPGKVRWLGG